MSRREVDSAYFRCCGASVRTGARIMTYLDTILVLLTALFVIIGQLSGYLQFCLWIYLAILFKLALLIGFFRGLRLGHHCPIIPYAVAKTIQAFLMLACTGLCVIAVVVAAQNMDELSGSRGHSGLRRQKRETDWRLPTPPSTLPPPFQYPVETSEYIYEEPEDYEEETPEPPIYPEDLLETMESKNAKPTSRIDAISPLDYPSYVDPMHSSYQEEERLRKLMLQNNDAFLSSDSESEEEEGEEEKGSKSNSDDGDYYPVHNNDLMEEEQSETGIEALEEEEEADVVAEEFSAALEAEARELHAELVKGAQEMEERDQWRSEPPLQLDGVEALRLDGAEVKVLVPETSWPTPMATTPLLRESVYERYPYLSGMLMLVRTQGMWALVGVLLLHLLLSFLLFTHAHLIVRTASLLRLMRQKAKMALLADPEPIAVIGTKPEKPKVHGIPIAFPAK